MLRLKVVGGWRFAVGLRFLLLISPWFDLQYVNTTLCTNGLVHVIPRLEDLSGTIKFEFGFPQQSSLDVLVLYSGHDPVPHLVQQLRTKIAFCRLFLDA